MNLASRWTTSNQHASDCEVGRRTWWHDVSRHTIDQPHIDQLQLRCSKLSGRDEPPVMVDAQAPQRRAVGTSSAGGALGRLQTVVSASQRKLGSASAVCARAVIQPMPRTPFAVSLPLQKRFCLKELLNKRHPRRCLLLCWRSNETASDFVT